MTEESWQISAEAAEVYEKRFVPAIFAEWAPRIADAGGVTRGDTVLDIACGTGVVARECARRGAAVTGLDLNPGMLAVARRIAPEVAWRQGDAADLPFPNGSFDAVLCQFGFMFFPDRAKAAREMVRVAKPGGRVVAATWASLDRHPAYARLADILRRRGGDAAAATLEAPFALSDRAALQALFADAVNVAVQEMTGVIRFDSIADLVEIEVKGSPLAERLTEAELRAVVDEATQALAPMHSGGGGYAIPAVVLVVRGDKA
jgi:SAM-dependent methyltransferase